MKPTRHTPLSCPVCKYLVDAAQPLNSKDTYVLKAGAISICFKCGAILEYVSAPEGLALAKCPDDVLHQLKTHQPKEYEMLMRAQRNIHQKLASNN